MAADPRQTDEWRTAVGGISCRLPKSDDVKQFWDNLVNEVDLVGPTRWPAGLYGLPTRAGCISDLSKFDAEFFGIPPEEAKNSNLLLRLLLEVIYECVVDSGLTITQLQNTKTGFYLACTFSDGDHVTTSKSSDSSHLNTRTELVTRVVSTFGFHGPVMSVDTACSSSLCALQMAVSDLHHRCRYAIVAGANLIVNPNISLQFHRLNMLNPTGLSLPFDKNAGGYVRSDGIVAMVLGRDVMDCKRAYCVVRDIGVNCDGYKKEGIIYPGEATQIELLKTVYGRSKIRVADVFYVEAHGTGTQAGDSVETSVLSEVLCAGRSSPLLIGSVKSNMGHSEACSGLVGVLKCILAFHHRIIPPNINYHVANPLITGISQNKLKVVTQPTALPGNCLVGVSSFGFGGVNGHIVLEPYRTSKHYLDLKEYIIPLTVGEHWLAEHFTTFIQSHQSDLGVLAMTACSMLGRNDSEVTRGYIKIGPGTEEIKVKSEKFKTSHEVWLLLDDIVWTSPAFDQDLVQINYIRLALECYDETLKTLQPSVSLISLLESGKSCHPLSVEGFVLGTGVLMSICELLKRTGIQFDGMLGCGISELVLAYVDGCISSENCLKIAHHLGKHLEKMETGKDYGEKFMTYAVHLIVQCVFRLGPYIQVISIIDCNLVIIAVPEQFLSAVLGEINAAGGFYTELAGHVPLYTTHFKETLEQLQMTLGDLILMAHQRSPQWLSCLEPIPHSSSKLRYGAFSSWYTSQLLGHCVNMPAVKKNVPKDAVVVRLTLMQMMPGACRREEQQPSIICKANISSVLIALGELHMLGYSVDVMPITTPVKFPLGCEIPPLSPLVTWNHAVSWPVFEWTYFSCTGRTELLRYTTLPSVDLYDPLALIIYHLLQLLIKFAGSRDYPEVRINLCQLMELFPEAIEGAKIYVQLGTRQFYVEKEGNLMLKGDFKILEGQSLPRIPGYDNNKESQLLLTEILWEDNWLEFFNAVLEFGYQKFQDSLMSVTINYKTHFEVVKRCASVLTAVEENTGLCKAGGILLQFFTKHMISSLKDIQLPVSEVDAAISRVILYNFTNQNPGRILVYAGVSSSNQPVIGLVVIADERIFNSEVPLLHNLSEEDLDKVVPLIIADHILHAVVQLRSDQSMFVTPAADSVSVYLMMLASQMGATVFTATWDPETYVNFEEMLPKVSILRSQSLRQMLLKGTSGKGSDVCIKVLGGELQPILHLVADDGLVVQCSLPSRSESIGMGVFLRNISVNAIQPFSSFLCFMEKPIIDQQSLLTKVQSDEMSQLWVRGFPEEHSCLYGVIERVKFSQPVKSFKLISLIKEWDAEPDNLASLLDNDKVAMERLRDAIGPKPQELSATDSEPSKLAESQTTEPEMSTPPELAPISTPVLKVTLPDKSPAKQKLPGSKGKHLPPLQMIKLRESVHSEVMVVGAPRSPISPAIQDLMMQSAKFESNLVPLNSLPYTQRPLFVIHPITGLVDVLRPLGQHLDVPCIGVKMNNLTPRESISEMACFYKNTIELEIPEGPYHLAGFSFGSCIALEMAIQMQMSNKQVDHLILLDGSPQYVHSQIDYIQKQAGDIREDKRKDFCETGYLVWFMHMYGAIPQRAQVLAALMQCPDINSKVEMAVDILMGEVVSSPTPAKRKWFGLRNELRRRSSSLTFLTTASEVVRLSRISKAKEFINSVNLADKYRPGPELKFKGDIHLLRIKTNPAEASSLPDDYGLGAFCTGNVHIRYYDGTHETFIATKQLSKDIMEIVLQPE